MWTDGLLRLRSALGRTWPAFDLIGQLLAGLRWLPLPLLRVQQPSMAQHPRAGRDGVQHLQRPTRPRFIDEQVREVPLVVR